MRILCGILFLGLIISFFGLPLSQGDKEIEIDPLKLLREEAEGDVLLRKLEEHLNLCASLKLRSESPDFYIEIFPDILKLCINVDFRFEDPEGIYLETLVALFTLMLKNLYVVYLCNGENCIYIDCGILKIKAKEEKMLLLGNKVLEHVMNIVKIQLEDCFFKEAATEIIQQGLAKTVTKLCFENCDLSGPAFDKFCRASEFVFDESYKMLGLKTHIQTLEIRSCFLGNKHRNKLISIFALLLIYDNVETLTLYNLNLTPEDIKGLVNFLIGYRKVRNLNLSGNPIGDEGAKHLARLLLKNTPLELLSLIRDIPMGGFISKEGTEALIEALKKAYENYGRTLCRLDLSGNPTGRIGKVQFYCTEINFSSEAFPPQDSSLLCSPR